MPIRYFVQHSIPLFLLTLATVLLSCGGEKQDLENSNNLVPRFSFGSEGEVVIAAAWQLATDADNSIFVPDFIAKRVYQFDFQGEFQQSYGREGRGPGEFINPLTLDTDGEWVYVQDTGNLRLISFKVDSDSSAIIQQNRSFVEFEIYQDHIFAFAPGNFTGPASALNEKLIRVYDMEGKLTGSFGKYLAMAEEIPQGMSWPYLAISGSIIHMAFQYFPIYRAYSIDGDLLVEQDLSTMVKEIPNPGENYGDQTRQGNRQDIAAVFRAMHVHGNRIFIARQAPSVVIDEYEFTDKDSLAYKTTYTYDDPQSERNYVQDFFYHPASNSFYILEIGDIPKVRNYALSP